ncbi:hypothetical protein JW968_05180 [Candidatus Woesearchaeota archaeon]|nr:hypothetical protein [Candidatus Woesearchaeota archaeon]
MRLSRKAQGAEYIGMVILIILLVLFVLFNRLGTASQTALRTEKTVRSYNSIYNLVSHSVVPRLSANDIPFIELYSFYTCYHGENADYEFGSIPAIQTIQNKSDLVFGRDRWKMELDQEICIESEAVFLSRCHLQDNIEYEAIDFSYPLFCMQERREGMLYVRITP